jgi:hypothetical protein
MTWSSAHGMGSPDLLLPGAPLALAALDPDARAQHAVADVAVDPLLLGGLEDVVVLGVVADRLEIRIPLLLGDLVRVLEEDELELGGDQHAVAGGGGALHLTLQDAARRLLDRMAVVIDQVAEDERRLLEPRDAPERADVAHRVEVLVAGLPARQPVAGQRVHVDVDGEQVGARVHPRAAHLVQVEARGDTLPHESPLQVGKGDQDRVDLAVADETLEVVRAQIAGHRSTLRAATVAS